MANDSKAASPGLGDQIGKAYWRATRNEWDDLHPDRAGLVSILTCEALGIELMVGECMIGATNLSRQDIDALTRLFEAALNMHARHEEAGSVTPFKVVLEAHRSGRA